MSASFRHLPWLVGRHRVWALALVLSIQPLLALVPTATAGAFPGGSVVGEGHAFDRCQDPSESQMTAFWTKTPYWWAGIYIGGSSMGCAQPNLSAQWLNDVAAQGWQLEFIWVGPQPPCSGYTNRFSPDPSVAYQQGRNEASSAWQTMTGPLQIANGAQGTALVYDLETSPSACQSATNSFVQGWVDQLHYPPAQVAGVYGSVCGSSMQSYAGLSPPPDFVWGAYYDGNPSTADLWAGSCGIPSNDWVNGQRLKQYNANVSRTYNGVTMTVDEDCAHGPLDPSGYSYYDSSCL